MPVKARAVYVCLCSAGASSFSFDGGGVGWPDDVGGLVGLGRHEGRLAKWNQHMQTQGKPKEADKPLTP